MNKVIYTALYVFVILLSVAGIIFNLTITNDATWAAVFGAMAGFNIAELLSLWVD